MYVCRLSKVTCQEKYIFIIVKRELTVDFDGRDVIYDVSELDELSLAYATTIHKSQGSEYPIAVMPVTMGHYVMLQRNLIYTGVTRAKKILVLIGDKKALSHARDFVGKRLAPAVIENDGKQTPMRGHPVFIAQQATATCCRECLRKWHNIETGVKRNNIDGNKQCWDVNGTSCLI